MSAEIDHAILMSYDAMRICMGQSPVNATVSEVIRWMQVISGEPDRIAELEKELENARTVQAQFSAERATALEQLAFQKRRFERSLESAKDTWATHEKQFADQQEKLDAANARNAELEVELFIRTKEKVDTLAARNAELEAEVARLREDGARLDKLDRNGAMIVVKDGTEGGNCIFGDLAQPGTLRAAIDAAMSAEGK